MVNGFIFNISVIGVIPESRVGCPYLDLRAAHVWLDITENRRLVLPTHLLRDLGRGGSTIMVPSYSTSARSVKSRPLLPDASETPNLELYLS